MASGVREREAPRVRVSQLVEREMVQRLETTTVIESESEISLLPRSSGIVVEVLAEEGDQVEPGTILARIDDRDAVLAIRDAEVAVEEARNRRGNLELSIEEARAGINNSRLTEEQARRDFERNDRLHGANDSELPSALSAQALEASRLELESSAHNLVMANLTLKRAESDAREGLIAISRAEVALQRAQIALDDRTIRAPISSVIAQRTIRVGDTVGGEAVFVLTDTENLRAIFYRPQRELSLFQSQSNLGDNTGLEILAHTEALPGAQFRGFIERASPTIDAQSGSFRITARLSLTPEMNEDGSDVSHMRLLPGMLVRLKIITDRHPSALVVHKRAVRREGEESFVLKVVDSRAIRVLVRESFADDDFVEIVSIEAGELVPGDSIITIGAREIEDGAEVRVETDGPDDEVEPELEDEQDAEESTESEDE